MEYAIDVVLIIVLALVCCAGLFLSVLQLPGTWLIVASSFAYSWYYGWERVEIPWLIGIVGIAIVAEVLEMASGVIAAKRGGASKRATWYGLFGGLAGALLLSIPVPLFGTLVGAAIGCFAGAFLAELQEGRGAQAGTKSGMFTAIGRTIGSMLKMFVAVIISSIVLVSALVGLWENRTTTVKDVPVTAAIVNVYISE